MRLCYMYMYLGLLLYHSHGKPQAIKLWKETIADDPSNINALQDLATASSKLRLVQDEESYNAQRRKAIEEATPEERKMIFARCQMEQGLALLHNLQKEWVGADLCKKQVQCFENAFKIAGDHLDMEEFKKEKQDWLLFMGRAHEKLSHVYFRDEQKQKYKESIADAIYYLDRCLQMSPERHAYHAQVWYTIGNSFATPRCDAEEAPSRIEDKYKEHWNDPSQCYKLALEIDPNNVSILAKLGVYLYKKDELDEACKRFDEAIKVACQKPESMRKCSWNAYYHRAKVGIKKAKDPSLPAQESFDILTKAKNDSARAVEYKFIPNTLSAGGEAHHLLAKHKLTNPTDKNDLMVEALQMFYDASILEDGLSISNTYLKWARCLKDKNDFLSAIECYKIALDAGRNYGYCFLRIVSRELLHAMLESFKRQNKLLKEVAFWFVYVGTKFASHTNEHPFKRFHWKFAFEILEVTEFTLKHVADISNSTENVCNMMTILLDKMEEWKSDTKFVQDFLPSHKSHIGFFLKKVQELRKQVLFIINNPPGRLPNPGPKDDDEHMSQNKALHDRFTYDFCVINDEGEPEIDGWVRYFLLTYLESKLYGNGLKGFWHQRMELGGLRYKTWANVIKESAHVLIILSHDFDGHVLTEMAQEAKGTKVVVIKRKHVQIPLNLVAYRNFDFTVQADFTELARCLMPVATCTL